MTSKFNDFLCVDPYDVPHGSHDVASLRQPWLCYQPLERKTRGTAQAFYIQVFIEQILQDNDRPIKPSLFLTEKRSGVYLITTTCLLSCRFRVPKMLIWDAAKRLNSNCDSSVSLSLWVIGCNQKTSEKTTWTMFNFTRLSSRRSNCKLHFCENLLAIVFITQWQRQPLVQIGNQLLQPYVQAPQCVILDTYAVCSGPSFY